jgi:hypothetical protein
MHPDEPVQGGRAHRHMPQGQGYQGHPGRTGAGRGLRRVQHAGHRLAARGAGRSGAGSAGTAAGGRAGDVLAAQKTGLDAEAYGSAGGQEARPLVEEAMAIMRSGRAALGDRHPHTMESISNMGWLLKAMGKPEEARPLLEEVLQARREALNNRHPDTLVSMKNMGSLLRDLGHTWVRWRRRGRCSRRGAAGAEGDAGRPPPEHAGLDRQHGPAADGHGQAGGGEAAVRGGGEGAEEDAGRPPRDADLDRQHGRAAEADGQAGGGEASAGGGATGAEGAAGRSPPGDADASRSTTWPTCWKSRACSPKQSLSSRRS